MRFWERIHHLHYGIWGMLLSAVAGAIGLSLHRLEVCGWSIWAGIIMAGWAADGYIGEKWGINTPASMLDKWLLKWWFYSGIKKWVNGLLKKDGADVYKH